MSLSGVSVKNPVAVNLLMWAVIVSGIWYWSTLPESSQKMYEAGVVGVAGGKLEGMARHFWLAVISGALDSPENAKIEIDFFFNEDEIHSRG